MDGSLVIRKTAHITRAGEEVLVSSPWRSPGSVNVERTQCEAVGVM